MDEHQNTNWTVASIWSEKHMWYVGTTIIDDQKIELSLITVTSNVYSIFVACVSRSSLCFPLLELLMEEDSN
jgi:hypothetical protein